MKNVLFLCTGNSCRSQMAEGWARQLLPESISFYSAGVEKHGINPWAMKAMAEAGVDISTHSSKLLSELDVEFDLVLTVCDNAHESCPVFPGNARVVHHSFDDPPRLAKDATNDEERMKPYRRVRDEIRTYIDTTLRSLIEENKQ